jgi:hypothetical protein
VEKKYMGNNFLPDWNDPKVRPGTMVRTALWLVQEIGLGNIFTKEQHRSAFSGVTQADRRLRDLRAHGWIIHTSSEDISLNSNEQRFIAMGSEVWDPVARQSVGVRKLTDKQRMAVFAKTDYQCSVCGIAGGERYADKIGVTAVLSASRRTVTRPDGRKEVIFLAECRRCSVGNPKKVEDIAKFLAEIDVLENGAKVAIVTLIANGTEGKLSELWKEFRQMSQQSRIEIQEFLK